MVTTRASRWQAMILTDVVRTILHLPFCGRPNTPTTTWARQYQLIKWKPKRNPNLNPCTFNNHRRCKRLLWRLIRARPMRCCSWSLVQSFVLFFVASMSVCTVSIPPFRVVVYCDLLIIYVHNRGPSQSNHKKVRQDIVDFGDHCYCNYGTLHPFLHHYS